MPEAAMTAKDAVGGPLPPSDEGRRSGIGPTQADEARPPVILSKVRIPLQRPVTLGRGRLLGWLDQNAADRVVVVSAEVGYGKSTLLADYARRSGTRCAWYRVEGSDADWISFLGHLVAAVRVALPGFGASTEALLRHVAAVGPTRDIVTSSLLAEMSDLPAERTLVVLDDFHLVGDSEDVRSILRRLLESAPEDWHFAIATRGRPTLPIGRLAAQGTVAELTTQELRFTRAEVGELFDLHLHQLSTDSLDIVYERTQGWAASLQLVLASVAASRPSEVEPFIAGLSGAQGPIHDLLAQEVLTRLDETTERVLIHASLLDRVTPELAMAALSSTDMAVDIATATACLLEAEGLGLLVTADDSSAGSRFHPLLRDFLRDRLERTTSQASIANMHIAIAHAAEDDDWLAAGAHYARGGQHDEAMRVLGSAAYKALGTGAWGAVTAVAAATPGVVAPPAVEVIRARALIAEGRAAEALLVLDSLQQQVLASHDLPLLGIARSAALHTLGNIHQLSEELRAIERVAVPGSVVALIARAWSLMTDAFDGGPVGTVRPALQDLAAASSRLGMHYFSGIAYHNEATAALAQADYSLARTLAVRARGELAISRTDVLASSLMTEALAAVEGGDVAAGLSLAREATAVANVQPDVLSDGAYLACLHGDLDRAAALTLRLKRALLESNVQLGVQTHAAFAESSYLTVLGHHRAAAHRIDALRPTTHDELDRATRIAFVAALMAVNLQSRDAKSRVRQALRTCDQQQAWRWQQRLRILELVANDDVAGFRREISSVASTNHLAVLETADAIVPILDRLEAVPEEIVHSVARYPGRWLPALTRQVERHEKSSGRSSAKLLAEFGTLDHLQPLMQFERAVGVRSRRRSYSKDLVRRTSPTLRVHDLGRTWYEIAGRSLRSSDSRRKASTLLLYLVTRPKQTATREQIMEDLWPDQAPDSALNSLHQTLHFVRRDIAPWVDEGVSADYVPMGLELVFLDPDLVQVDSVAFLRQATAAISSQDLARRGPDLFGLYSGRFAPEFEYEEWAADWRTLVHTTYLHLTHATAQALSTSGRVTHAAEILTRALEVDPSAFNLHVSLVRTLASLGGKDAAIQQYQRFEALVQRDVGVAPPTFDEILEGGELVDLG